MKSKSILVVLFATLAATAPWVMPATAGGQIFVTNYGNGTIGEYTTAGATVNAALISGLNGPTGIVVSGGNLFVANYGSGTIGEYTTSGATVNAALISGLDQPSGLAVSGGNLFVVNNNANGTIGEYTTSGATVNAALISGLSDSWDLAVSGRNLFVTNYSYGTISEYTTAGATVNAALIAGLDTPAGIAVSGDNLFVGNLDMGTIGEYNTDGTTVNTRLVSGLYELVGVTVSAGDLFTTKFDNGSNPNSIGEYTTSGATVNSVLVSGLDLPWATAVVPEPATWALLVTGAAGLLLWHVAATRKSSPKTAASRATTRWPSLLCRRKLTLLTLGGVLLFGARTRAETMISVNGGMGNGLQGVGPGIEDNEYLASYWTMPTSFTNVSYTVAANALARGAGTTEDYFLMDAIGPSATPANVIWSGSTTFSSGGWSDGITPIFSGLSLAPGAYYLIIDPSAEITWQPAWGNGLGEVVATSDDVSFMGTLTPAYGRADLSFPPASTWWGEGAGGEVEPFMDLVTLQPSEVGIG